MQHSVRGLLVGLLGVAIASACATGVADGIATDSLPTMAKEEGAVSHRGCASADGGLVRRPDVAEICNGEDDNCDGRIDEGFDLDGDRWVSCTIGNRPADCDDHDPDVNFGVVEICNGKDDDCDGKTDEDFDNDNDGVFSCPSAKGPPDCDDTDRKIYPGAPERCNGKDDDCDGTIDEVPANLAGRLTAPVDQHWVLAGAASYSSAWVLLTPERRYTAGALWWNASYLFDTFDVHGTISFGAKTDCADGMAFVWTAGTNVSAVGDLALGYGANSLPGYAIAIDTFTNSNEPIAPFLVVLDARTKTHLHRQSVPELRDGRAHELRVKLDQGRVSVWLDSISYVSDFAIPGYVPFEGHWGFTAATGELTCAQWVTGVRMSFPNGQGCVP